MRASRVATARKHFDWLSSQLQIQTQQDWYQFSREQVVQIGGRTVLLPFQDSYCKSLETVYPEFEWSPWKFSKTVPKFWEKKENQRKYFDWLAQELDLQTQENFYSLTIDDVLANYGRTSLSHHGNTLFDKLKNIYCEFEWHPWLFETPSANIWQNEQNHRRFLEWIQEELHLKTLDELCNVAMDELTKKGGRTILSIYGTVSAAVETLFPESNWSKSFPYPKERKFFDDFAAQIGLQMQQEWYTVKVEEVRDRKGRNVLDRFGSLSEALSHSFPEFEWHPWLFSHVSNNFWLDLSNQKKCLEWLGSLLQIQHLSEWEQVSPAKVTELGGGGLLAFYGGNLANALLTVYPEHDWSLTSPSFANSEGEIRTVQMLQSLLHSEAMQNHKVLHSPSNRKIELDVYFPDLKLAIEYQGKQHYTRIACGIFGNLEERTERDLDKKKLCHEMGICLVQIPYWWNASLPSLASTIRRHRPDLLLNHKATEDTHSTEQPEGLVGW